MTSSAPASLLCLLLCATLPASPAALAQTASGSHQTPPKQKPARAAKPPVIQAHGPTHPQKPPQTAATPAPVPTPAEPPQQATPESTKGSATGLPLPRFVALRFDEVNMRAGPGTRYPIEWLYKRRDLPVQILREFEVWRLIEDSDGTKGWVHQATLTGRRSFMVTGADATLRREPQETAAPVAILKPGVIGHLRACLPGSDWCQAQVADYRGYLKRGQFWGALANEVVGGG